MRVMILVPGLPMNLDNIKGGVHSAVINLLKGFAKYDIDVRVVSFSREVEKGKDAKINITDRIEVHYSYEGPYNYHSANYFLIGPGLIKKHIRDFKPDVIHYQEGSSLMFTRIWGLMNTKFLQTIHGMALAEAKRKKTFKDKITWYFNGALQVSMLPRNVIHLSQFSVNLFKRKRIKHSAIIPNAITPHFFSLTPKTKTDNMMLYIGIIDNNKNLIYLLQNLNELIKRGKKFTLNVLGDYRGHLYKEVIEKYIRENKLDPYVIFNGWVPQTTVLKFIENSDILVVASKHESLPMVIAESMAAGKVVIASDVGGIPEMINDGVDGFLFTLNDENGLANVLETLHNNDEKMQMISKNAAITAKRYDCETVAKKTIEFYNGCLNILKIRIPSDQLYRTNKKTRWSYMIFFDKITDKLFRKQWNIGLAKINAASLIKEKNYNPDFKWLPIDTHDRFFADPFIFKTPEGNINVIYEDFSVEDQYGKISLTAIDANFRPVFSKLMLDTRSHLSYPNVFVSNNKTYIIPESSKSGHVTCYEYDFINNVLINGKNIIQNLPLLDSTILVHNNKYWLFATKRGENSNSKLYIYYANEMEGPYIPHAANPVKSSLNGSRPAGNFIIIDGEIYRPSQNCAEYYGKSVTINKITVLTEKEFAEEAILEISPPQKSGFNYGIHTINIVDDVIVIDALKRIFMPVEQVKTFFKKAFKRNKPKNASA